jgi:hypothetical protein
VTVQDLPAALGRVVEHATRADHAVGGQSREDDRLGLTLRDRAGRPYVVHGDPDGTSLTVLYRFDLVGELAARVDAATLEGYADAPVAAGADLDDRRAGALAMYETEFAEEVAGLVDDLAPYRRRTDGVVEFTSTPTGSVGGMRFTARLYPYTDPLTTAEYTRTVRGVTAPGHDALAHLGEELAFFADDHAADGPDERAGPGRSFQ